ncbi:MAG: hypothetical protein ABIJ12_08640 [bacterium]
MHNRSIYLVILIIILIVGIFGEVMASDKVTINSGVDFYNRYVWRGLDIANTPSLQPALSVAFSGLEIGTWGAYTMSNEASESDEIDFWLGYTIGMENGVSLSFLATDYYFPNAGIDFFNFNNHDAVIDDTIPDQGAHTIEIGASFTGPESFPITISGYLNVYNDAGSNTYFQVDYPVKVGETELGLFIGATGGSKDNPGYYGSDEFDFINLGVTASREIKVSETFSIPFNVSFIVNPNDEISHLVVGLSF